MSIDLAMSIVAPIEQDLKAESDERSLKDILFISLVMIVAGVWSVLALLLIVKVPNDSIPIFLLGGIATGSAAAASKLKSDEDDLKRIMSDLQQLDKEEDVRRRYRVTQKLLKEIHHFKNKRIRPKARSMLGEIDWELKKKCLELEQALPTEVEYVGEARLPKQAYKDNSLIISINLHQVFPTTPKHESVNVLEKDGSRLISVHVPLQKDVEQFLEIEIISAGITTDGEKRQRQSLDKDLLSYHWSCGFPISGDHRIGLILRLVGSDTVEIGVIEHQVRVVRLDHLTQRGVWLLASAFAFVSGILAMAQILKVLGIL
jgi:hypothetical protein